jgi:hypothetical protein
MSPIGTECWPWGDDRDVPRAGKLGEAEMVLYLGKHTLLGRRAAIKVLLPLLSANEAIARRFFNQTRDASRPGHHRHTTATVLLSQMECA